MNKNAFNFSTVTTPAAGEVFFAYYILCWFLYFAIDVAAAKKVATDPKPVEKKGLFASASPAMSRMKAAPTTARKYSLRATETSMCP
jgi:hypothetical protein